MYVYLCEYTVYVLDSSKNKTCSTSVSVFCTQFPVGDGYVNIKCVNSACVRKQIIVKFISLLLPYESVLY